MKNALKRFVDRARATGTKIATNLSELVHKSKSTVLIIEICSLVVAVHHVVQAAVTVWIGG